MENAKNVTQGLTLVLLLTLTLTLAGCDNPFGKDSDDKPSGTPPTLSQIVMYRYDADADQLHATYTYTIGDIAYIEFFAQDPELDMQTLTVRQTHLASGNSDAATFDLPAQTHPEMFYYIFSEIIGPTGGWTVEARITDAAGLKSQVIKKTVTVQ
jgi:hypothetical protein